MAKGIGRAVQFFRGNGRWMDGSRYSEEEESKDHAERMTMQEVDVRKRNVRMWV